jgi:hypothetical protein
MHPEQFAARCYLSRRDAAQYLGLSPSFLAKAAISGKGPEFLKIGRRVLYDRELLDAFAADHRRQSTSETHLRVSSRRTRFDEVASTNKAHSAAGRSTSRAGESDRRAQRRRPRVRL